MTQEALHIAQELDEYHFIAVTQPKEVPPWDPSRLNVKRIDSCPKCISWEIVHVMNNDGAVLKHFCTLCYHIWHECHWVKKGE